MLEVVSPDGPLTVQQADNVIEVFRDRGFVEKWLIFKLDVRLIFFQEGGSMQQTALFGDEGIDYSESITSTFCHPVDWKPPLPLSTLHSSEFVYHPLKFFITNHRIEYDYNREKQYFYWPTVSEINSFTYYTLYTNHSLQIADITLQLRYIEDHLGEQLESELWDKLDRFGGNLDWRRFSKHQLDSVVYWIIDVGKLIEQELDRLGLIV